MIETRCGRIVQFARLTDAIHPRVIVASHGWWFPEESEKNLYDWDRSNLNMLTSTARLGWEFGTPNLKGSNLIESSRTGKDGSAHRCLTNCSCLLHS